MKIFAVLDNENIVCNTIIADSLQDAESLTGSRCIEQTEYNGIPYIGLPYDGSYFIPAKLYPSWVWDSELKVYVAPVSKPEGNFMWDEVSKSWIENDIPSYPAP